MVAPILTKFNMMIEDFRRSVLDTLKSSPKILEIPGSLILLIGIELIFLAYWGFFELDRN
jgi:hypothetical protein